MAFLSKIGNILRHTRTTQINAQLSTSRPGLCQVFRSMSTSLSSKLFVGGIFCQIDDQGLKEAFSKYSEVIEARVIVDRETGRSRGFDFVTYTSTKDASSALQALDGQVLHGHQVRVNYAAERPPPNFGGGGYRSGYGSGDYGSGNYEGQGSYGDDNYGTGGVGYGSNFGQSGANNYNNGSFNVAAGGNDSFAIIGSGGDQFGSSEDGCKEEKWNL